MSDGLILPSREYWPAAVQSGAGALEALDLPATNPAVVTLITGSNQSYPALKFANGGASLARRLVRLPPDCYVPGGIAARLLWSTPATSGDMRWTAETAFVDESADLDPAFNAADEFVQTVEAVAGALAKTDAALDTTGAVAGALMILQIGRDSADGDDTLADDAHLIGVELQYQRLIVLP
jgi:hypothetical protein